MESTHNISKLGRKSFNHLIIYQKLLGFKTCNSGNIKLIIFNIEFQKHGKFILKDCNSKYSR